MLNKKPPRSEHWLQMDDCIRCVSLLIGPMGTCSVFSENLESRGTRVGAYLNMGVSSILYLDLTVLSKDSTPCTRSCTTGKTPPVFVNERATTTIKTYREVILRDIESWSCELVAYKRRVYQLDNKPANSATSILQASPTSPTSFFPYTDL